MYIHLCESKKFAISFFLKKTKSSTTLSQKESKNSTATESVHFLELKSGVHANPLFALFFELKTTKYAVLIPKGLNIICISKPVDSKGF